MPPVSASSDFSGARPPQSAQEKIQISKSGSIDDSNPTGLRRTSVKRYNMVSENTSRILIV
jgi:hypothetical protein